MSDISNSEFSDVEKVEPNPSLFRSNSTSSERSSDSSFTKLMKEADKEIAINDDLIQVIQGYVAALENRQKRDREMQF